MAVRRVPVGSINSVTAHRGEQHKRHRLTKSDVDLIRSSPELSNAELARMFGVERSTIRLVRANVTWRDPSYTPTTSRHWGAGMKPEWRKK